MPVAIKAMHLSIFKLHYHRMPIGGDNRGLDLAILSYSPLQGNMKGRVSCKNKVNY